MALDWIKVELTLPDKPEVFTLAARLGIPAEHVAGCLLRWFIWLDQQSPDGHVRVTQLSAIDAVVRHTGFGQALAEVGWAVLGEKGLIVPNWDRHNGKGAKIRGLSMYRKRKERHDFVAKPSRKKRDQRKRQENRDSPSSTKKEKRTPLGPMPAEFTERFVETDPGILEWNESKGYKKGHLGLHYEYFKLAVEKTDLHYAGMKGWTAAFKKAVREDWAAIRSKGERKSWLGELTGTGKGGEGRVIEGTAERSD